MNNTIAPHARQFFLYLLTGSAATIVDIGGYFALLYFGAWYVAASVVSGVAGFICAFLFHKYFAFQVRHSIGNHFVRYCILGAWNIFATNFILFATVEWVGIAPEIAKFVANGAVVLWNFFAYKFFVYV